MDFLDQVSGFLDDVDDAVKTVKKTKAKVAEYRNVVKEISGGDAQTAVNAVKRSAVRATNRLGRRAKKKAKKVARREARALKDRVVSRLIPSSDFSRGRLPTLAANDSTYDAPFGIPGIPLPPYMSEQQFENPVPGDQAMNLPAILKTAEQALTIGAGAYGAYRSAAGNRLPSPHVSNPPTGVYVPGFPESVDGDLTGRHGGGWTEYEVRAPGLYVVAIGAGVLQANRNIPRGFQVQVVDMAGRPLGDFMAHKQIPARALIWFNHPNNALSPAYWPGLQAVPGAGVYTEGDAGISCTLLKRKPKRRRKTLTPKRLARFRQLAKMVDTHDKLIKKTKRLVKMR